MRFRGTSIGFATLGGTVRAFDRKKKKFVKIDIDYSDQELSSRKTAEIMKTKKSFYNIGFTVDSDRQEYDGAMFDYVIFIKKTRAI